MAHTIMNTLYPLKTINQLRPLLIGFRKVNGLTQKDVAERLGVTQQTYARLEANPGSASIERLFKVFTVLGVEIELSSPLASSTINSDKLTDKYRDSPARREKW
ncbi:transcriptional regulator [Klebsiella pneumoniae]|nr:transcriptional regulator [Klebsiella pneumoniae]